MKSLGFDHQWYLDAFMKTAQYLASLPTHDDIWDHIKEVMVTFYKADLVAFAKPDEDGRIGFHHLVLPAKISRDFLKTEAFQEVIREVLESGFLGWRLFPLREPQTIIFLPVNLGNKIAAVMLVGHASTGPVSNELLNVYLAVAGLAGSTITRHHSEIELKTQRAHLEKLVIELKAYAERLEFLNQELQEFTFVASHDLQEPLRKIQTFGNLLDVTCRDSLSDRGRDYLLRMTKSASRMSALLDALLSYSRAAMRPEPFVPVDLTEVARDAVSDLELAITHARGSVEIRPLPFMEVDPAQMRQLFQNLISNALKYRRTGEQPRIKVSGEMIDKSCLLYIEDNGLGFNEEYLDRIFKPFQRLHGRNEYEGTGMGLAICRKIVERHGGAITAKSAPGQGSVFIVTLPKNPAGEKTYG